MSSSVPKVASSRPLTDRGVTFHFRHTFVSKKGRSKTSAAAHQSYIERESAVDRGEATSSNGKTDALSFGTLGDTPKDRRAFWRKLEEASGMRGRIQCRLVVEIPHELSAARREALARTFCATFSEKSLPFWCSLHAPSDRNDKRNYHMHIVYSDRPARRLSDGRWDFEIEETRNGRTRRPFRQNKDREAQGSQWIKSLREFYAECANGELSKSGHRKRLDPRSYREAGVPKAPTLHLGPQAWSLEAAGEPTKPGASNSIKEILFRTSAWSALLSRQLQRIERLILDVSERMKLNETARKIGTALKTAAERYRSITVEIFKTRRDQQINDVVIEALTLRPEQKRRHLLKKVGKKQDSDTRKDLTSAERALELARPQSQALRLMSQELRLRQNKLAEEQNRIARRVSVLSERFDAVAPKKVENQVSQNLRTAETLIETQTYVFEQTEPDISKALAILRAQQKRPQNKKSAPIFDEVPTEETTKNFIDRYSRKSDSELTEDIQAASRHKNTTLDAIDKTHYARAELLLLSLQKARQSHAQRGGQSSRESRREKNADADLDIG